MMKTSLGVPHAKAIATHERLMKRWEKRKAKWPWRDYLTSSEREILAKADLAKAEWLKLNRERAAITNRAIQRAKYHARTP